jgi:hypothetical protein
LRESWHKDLSSKASEKSSCFALFKEDLGFKESLFDKGVSNEVISSFEFKFFFAREKS